MLAPTWKIPHDQIPALWRDWLLYAGSFMQRLLQKGVQDARIEVLNECWQKPDVDENQLLDSSPDATALVREVIILSENNEWMFARTVIPQGMLNEQPQLAHLSNRPLGSMLFSDPNIRRGEFAIAHLQSEQRWHTKVSTAVKKSVPDLWARRSLFTLQQEALLLTEVFLPAIATL